MLDTMEFFLDKNYFDEIRNTAQDAINYAIRNHQELVEEALAKTEKIRYSKYVSGLGPWCPFYSNRDDDASFPLFDSPKRFKSGDYTAYHLINPVISSSFGTLFDRNWNQNTFFLKDKVLSMPSCSVIAKFRMVIKTVLPLTV